MSRRHNREGSVYERKDRPGTWAAAVTVGYVDGKRKRRVVYGKSAEEVQAKKLRMLSSLADGRPATDSSVRLDVYLDGWLRDVVQPNVEATTHAGYAWQVRKHIAPLLGHHRLAELQPSHVRAWLLAKSRETSNRGRPYSDNSLRLMHAALRAALASAVSDQLVTRNVAALAKRPRPTGPRFKGDALGQDEAVALLEAARHDRLSAMWRLAVSTGMRKGELIALRWDDVDLASGQVHVQRSIARITGQGLVEKAPKNPGSDRTFNVGPRTVSALRSHKAAQAVERLAAGSLWSDSGRVFTTARGTTIDPRSVNRLLDALYATAGVRRTRVHDLRHTTATLLFVEGEDSKVVGELLGHSEDRTTREIYAHVIEAQRHRAADRLDSLLGDAGSL
jgi:integrase